MARATWLSSIITVPISPTKHLDVAAPASLMLAGAQHCYDGNFTVIPLCIWLYKFQHIRIERK